MVNRKVNLADVAEKLGVSRTTVSLVVSGHPRISKATAERVWACIEELGYRPDMVARSLATGRSSLIGVIVPDSSNPFFAEIFRGAEEVARENGLHLLLNNGSYRLSVEEDRIRDLLGLRVGGLLACPAFVKDEDSRSGIWAELRRREFPVVLLNRRVEPPVFHQVGVDNAGGIRKALDHLYALGHRRIGIIHPSHDILPVRQRMKEVRSNFTRLGLRWEAAWVAEGPVTLAGGHEAARRIWDGPGTKPTALFSLTDTMGLGALKYSISSGRRVPADVSIVAMDGTPYSEYGLVPITSVETPLFEMGRTAIELLRSIINGSVGGELRSVVMPMTLKERSSSGPVAESGQ